MLQLPRPPSRNMNMYNSSSQEHQYSSPGFLSISQISTILRTIQLKQPTKDVTQHSANTSEEEKSVLNRICHCEVEGKAEYASELDRLMKIDPNHGQQLLYNESPFDIGFVEDARGKLLWVISSPLKRAVEKLLAPHVDIHSDEGIVCIPPPYEPFFRKYEEVKDFLNNELARDGGHQAWLALDYFMKQNAPKRIWNVPQTFARGASVSYEELWTLFRPKDKMFMIDNAGNKEMLEFVSMNSYTKPRPPDPREMLRPPPPTYREAKLDYLQVFAWGIIKDRYSQNLKPQKYQIILEAFEGKRPITSLRVYPVHYFENENEEAKVLQDLRQRGLLWRKLNFVEQWKCYYYKGIAFRRQNPRDRPSRPPPPPGGANSTISDFNAQQLAGRFVIGREASDHGYPDRERIEWCVQVMDNIGLEKYTDQDIENNFESYAFLCPSLVHGVDIKTQQPYLLGMTESLQDVRWNKDLFEKHLIISSVKKSLLSGLIRNRMKENYRSMGDLVEKKGTGLIVVLHGPPGTGKTFVAEAIADYFERPLRALSIGELIADRHRLEEKLIEVFDQCKRWDAILLLDEADVVLEARSFEDVARNAIVSTFLRNLEYFEGIMFLTTNRIGTIDEAFMSRIQIAIHMDTLQAPERKKLWERFLGAPTSDKEADDRANERLYLTPNSRRVILEHIDEWAEMKLNGREIRNTINIAQSLAYTYNGADGLMSPRDIRDAAGEALEFRRHLSNAKEESERAASSVWGGSGYGRQ